MFGKTTRTIAIGAGAAAVAVGGMAAPALATEAAEPTLVSLYDLPGYGGENYTQLVHGGGTFCLTLGTLDNRVSSVRLSGPVRVTVFDGRGCFGESLDLPGSLPDLSLSGWDNRISSVRITA